jgi:spermidine/putrescine transport system permease protein
MSLKQAWRRRRGLRIAALFAPMLLILGVCMLGPLSVMLVYSFWRVENFSLVQELSLDNYAYLSESPLYFWLVGKALFYGAVVTIVTLVISVPVAYFMARHVGPHKGLIITAILLPLYTSELIRYFAWRTILGTEGLLNSALLRLGVISESIEMLSFSPLAVIISLSHIYLPFMILAIWVALEALNPALLDAAMDLGARPLRMFRKIVLPLAMPGIIAGVIFVFIPVTGEFFGVNLMGGTTGFTITNAINDQFTSAFNWPLGSALSFMLLLSIGIVVAIFLVFISRLRILRNFAGREA